jgi:fatty acid desaturase
MNINVNSFHKDIAILKKEIKQSGWNKRLPFRMASELLFHLLLMTGGILLFVFVDNIPIRICAMIASTIGAIGVTTHTHSSSHYTTFNNRRLDEFLVYFGYSFLFGTSATYWWNKHVKVHHPNPNIHGIDDDIDLRPIFAFTKDEIAKSNSRFQKFIFRNQGIIFPIALIFNGFNIQLSGWRYLVSMLFDKKQRDIFHWIDLLVLIFHWVFWLVLPCYFFSLTDVLIFHFIRIALLGYGMYVAFAPAHFPAESIVLAKDTDHIDSYLRQLVTTVNFKTGPFGRLLCSGVDYQIEHHLFPGVTHTYYPLLSIRLKKICKKNGYPYRELGWWEAVWKSYVVFFSPRDIYFTLEDVS